MEKEHPKTRNSNANKNEPRLFVGGLFPETSSSSLKAYFQRFGEVLEVKIIGEKQRRSRGFGFVLFKSWQVFHKVLNMKHVIEGREVDCNHAVYSHQNPDEDEDQNKRKVFVRSIPLSFDKGLLRGYFERFGRVEKVLIVKRRNKKRAFCFVEFAANEASVARVLQVRHNITGEEGGQLFNCEAAQPKSRKGREEYRGGLGAGYKGSGGSGKIGSGRGSPGGYGRSTRGGKGPYLSQKSSGRYRASPFRPNKVGSGRLDSEGSWGGRASGSNQEDLSSVIPVYYEKNSKKQKPQKNRREKRHRRPQEDSDGSSEYVRKARVQDHRSGGDRAPEWGMELQRVKNTTKSRAGQAESFKRARTNTNIEQTGGGGFSANQVRRVRTQSLVDTEAMFDNNEQPQLASINSYEAKFGGSIQSRNITTKAIKQAGNRDFESSGGFRQSSGELLPDIPSGGPQIQRRKRSSESDPEDPNYFDKPRVSKKHKNSGQKSQNSQHQYSPKDREQGSQERESQEQRRLKRQEYIARGGPNPQSLSPGSKKSKIVFDRYGESKAELNHLKQGNTKKNYPAKEDSSKQNQQQLTAKIQFSGAIVSPSPTAWSVLKRAGGIQPGSANYQSISGQGYQLFGSRTGFEVQQLRRGAGPGEGLRGSNDRNKSGGRNQGSISAESEDNQQERSDLQHGAGGSPWGEKRTPEKVSRPTLSALLPGSWASSLEKNAGAGSRYSRSGGKNSPQKKQTRRME